MFLPQRTVLLCRLLAVPLLTALHGQFCLLVPHFSPDPGGSQHPVLVSGAMEQFLSHVAANTTDVADEDGGISDSGEGAEVTVRSEGGQAIGKSVQGSYNGAKESEGWGGLTPNKDIRWVTPILSWERLLCLGPLVAQGSVH